MIAICGYSRKGFRNGGLATSTVFAERNDERMASMTASSSRWSKAEHSAGHGWAFPKTWPVLGFDRDDWCSNATFLVHFLSEDSAAPAISVTLGRRLSSNNHLTDGLEIHSFGITVFCM